MSTHAAIHAQGLVKRFGDVTAVDGLDLVVRSGTCLSLLGPNGAGKTTTIEILEGLAEPDAGDVSVLGLAWRDSAREIRERIGVQLQETKLDDKLKVHEVLRLFKSLYRTSRAESEVLELVDLQEKRTSRVVDLSGGQRQRLTLACALVSRPELLFLDEPTTGLDPQARRRVWEIVEGFKRAGGTVLLTTHYMEEAERLADDVVILDEGRVLREGSPREIIGALGAESIVELCAREPQAFEQVSDERLRAIEGVSELTRQPGGALTFTVTRTQESLSGLLDLCHELGVELDDLHTHRPTLEDVFVTLTGKQLRDG